MDKVVEQRRPVIVLVKKEKITLIINIAVPGDMRVNMKEKEKIEVYKS